MSDRSGIEWTDATWTDSRGRVRTYQRQDSTRPGQQLRRQMAILGLSWCRRCHDWLPAMDVRQGACKLHLAEEYRQQYAANPAAIRARVHARKRDVDPMPMLGMEYLLEQFDSRCAYCPAAAESWDHIVPIATGGQTEPGNVVPACLTCNSSKKDADVFVWLIATSRQPSPAFYDVLALEVAAA